MINECVLLFLRYLRQVCQVSHVISHVSRMRSPSLVWWRPLIEHNTLARSNYACVLHDILHEIFGRPVGDILDILGIITRIHLSRTIWNNSYLFIMITILLIINSKKVCLCLFTPIYWTVIHHIPTQNGVSYGALSIRPHVNSTLRHFERLLCFENQNTTDIA